MEYRYIDAFALENRVEDFEKLTGIKLDIVHDFVSSQPTADVVEVVRCKDCAKRECCRTSTVWAVPPNDDWYCADAERRTDERLHQQTDGD